MPLGLLTCVTGVSGSGKSTLIIDTLFNYAAAYVNGTMLSPTKVERVEGLQQIDRIIDIDQSPIGRTPRSNPATYTGCSHRCASCSQLFRKPARAATTRAASAST